MTPGKGGQKVEGVPVFNTVRQAVQKEGANVACIFVPPPFAADAVIDAAASGIEVIVCITEGIPVLDMVKVSGFLRAGIAYLSAPTVRELFLQERPR